MNPPGAATPAGHGPVVTAVPRDAAPAGVLTSGLRDVRRVPIEDLRGDSDPTPLPDADAKRVAVAAFNASL